MAHISESSLRESIAAILKDADLRALSSKQVRKQLENEYNTDLTDRKEEIDGILMEMITNSQNDNDQKSDEEEEEEDEASDNSEASSENEQSASQSENEASASESEKSSASSDDSDKAPPKKKQKTLKKTAPKSKTKAKSSSQSDDSEVDDEALARKLQEEEIKSRSRAVKKSSGNKKEKGGSGGGGGGKETKQKKENSYTRKCLLSPALAEVVGCDKMARHDVVKKMWGVVRERNLFDPNNKQYAVCDDQLHKIFGTKRVRMFGMMKYLKNHMTDLKQVP